MLRVLSVCVGLDNPCPVGVVVPPATPAGGSCAFLKLFATVTRILGESVEFSRKLPLMAVTISQNVRGFHRTPGINEGYFKKWLESAMNLIQIIFYPRDNKLLVRPGQEESERLFNFFYIF